MDVTRSFVEIVKEFGDGLPWILIEMHQGIAFGDVLVSNRFERGTSYNHAREVARILGTELFVHGRDGRICERDSHGWDPFPPKG